MASRELNKKVRMGSLMPAPQNHKVKCDVPFASRRRGVVRRLPVSSDLPLDLPITRQEIQMVAEALGAKIATLFDEDE